MTTRDHTIGWQVDGIHCRYRIGASAVAAVAAWATGRRVAVVVDARVQRRHHHVAEAILAVAAHGRRLILPGGEAVKSPQRLLQLLRWLGRNGLPRDGLVVGVGGGTLLDLVGLGAALWQRGVDYAAVATTLLAAVDAAIGGKTAIDLDGVKNPVGAFHPALLTAVDPALLATLPRREWRQGMAELVKTAVLGDAVLFRSLERRRDDLATALARGRANRPPPPAALPWHRWIRRAAAVKIGLVERDFRENGPRRALNLGHTLGHALEPLLGIGHGEAVALGLAVAARLAARRGLCTATEAERIIALLAACGLPTSAPAPPRARVAALVARDKKRAAGVTRWVLPAGIGRVVLDVPVTVNQALALLAV